MIDDPDDGAPSRSVEYLEWRCFSAADALAALAGGADDLFLRQLQAVGAVYDRLADKSDPLRCVVCLKPIGAPPGLIGWVKPVKQEEVRPFALCYACAEDDSDDFRQRFLAAIGGEGAYDVPAGRA